MSSDTTDTDTTDTDNTDDPGVGAGVVEHYRLPDAGEGLTEAEILIWRVAVGDTIEVNDVVVEIETAKAVVELPCPYAGTVEELLAQTGQTVAVGAPILAVRTSAASGAAAPAPASDQESASDAEQTSDPEHRGPTAESGAHPSTQAAAGAGRTAVLVGYGPAAGATRRRARRAAVADGVATRAQTPDGDAAVLDAAVPDAAVPDEEASATGPAKVLAKPPVRKLAKDLGVDLGAVEPTGEGGVVTREDVLAAAGPPSTLPGRGHAPVRGEERRISVKGVRKATADAMVASAFTAPHVTEWLQVDVSGSVELLDQLKADRSHAGQRLTVFTLVARAVCLATRRHPEVNVTWDGAAQEIVVHPEVHLGFAAATGRGLVVPVVHGAEGMDLAGLAQSVGELVSTAREGRLQPAQMSGGTLTITNVGVFGVDGGTPILPPGTGLILACGQVRRLPWVVDEQVVPRWVTTLAVSFDHRMIDGELGSRFLADVARLLEEPGYALAWA